MPSRNGAAWPCCERSVQRGVIPPGRSLGRLAESVRAFPHVGSDEGEAMGGARHSSGTTPEIGRHLGCERLTGREARSIWSARRVRSPCCGIAVARVRFQPSRPARVVGLPDRVLGGVAQQRPLLAHQRRRRGPGSSRYAPGASAVSARISCSIRSARPRSTFLQNV